LFSTRKPYSLAPSNISAPGLGGDLYKAQAMTSEQIEELIDAFADACLRAKTCGYDMAEIHGATGYAVEQFYSPSFNKRTDHWGGDFESRIQFPLEILRRAKKKCGPDFPIGFRILGMDGFPNGWDIDEAIPLAQRLEAEGAAYISVTALTYTTFPIGEGYFCPRSPKNNGIGPSPTCKQYTEAVNIQPWPMGTWWIRLSWRHSWKRATAILSAWRGPCWRILICPASHFAVILTIFEHAFAVPIVCGNSSTISA